ncbi:GerMN domain-containing protein [Leptolyngbya cf. ectocarpi LEGE 11479]|uniref:GerMN domain-containing protein n=1 Tax=Leptolyngbya cf. ectocarpi LEGE 11479 TaxID=1828722 RepID=A0A928ZWD5_LEPEC|nr:GerMN domain-containing protein [Leptolyngbya ectocarpi]MBE9068667.1 GerMN domain-containing protein [Leptolyngbya cf. ectocarpi LEGE 11479]
MNEQKTLPPFNLRTLEMYLVAIILGAAAGWGYWWTSQQSYPPEDVIPVQSFELSDAIATLKSSLPPELSAVLTVQPQAYWVNVVNQQETLIPQPLALDTQSSPEERLTTALETLLVGSVKIDNAFTAIPKGTQLMSLSMNDRGIYIDLSQEFAGGGGSSSMIYRVAQVIYTSTSLDPDAAVYLSVGGHMISDTYPLGGEGLVLDQPVTRETFAKDFQGF